MIRVIGPKDPRPQTGVVVNTTSRSDNWSRGLSPFFLGPIDLYNGYTAKTFESGWQFAKLYPQHADSQGNPTAAYWAWAQQGWANPRAERYPMGRGAKPLHALWEGKKLGYVESRKQIYAPLYARAVQKTNAFSLLKVTYAKAQANGQDLWLWDFDGYDHVKLGMSLDEVLNDPTKKMGHAFVLTALLTQDPEFPCR